MDKRVVERKEPIHKSGNNTGKDPGDRRRREKDNRQQLLYEYCRQGRSTILRI
jgi:hypothetical protein